MANICRVLMVDDYPLMRKGVRQVLDAEPDIELVGEVGEVEGMDELLELCQRYRPNVLLYGTKNREHVPVERIASLREQIPEMAILVLAHQTAAGQANEVLAAGATGFYLKNERAAQLPDAIRAVSQGGTWISPALLPQLQAEPPPLPDLTPRERQLLHLVAQGKSTREMAQALNLAEQTVRNYLYNIYQKLHVSSREEALIWALDHGFGSLD
ncbi:MAG: response regulator transcription factor [Chloroflexota bacterium]|nr:response regulator transcription factor [Chloroflexota bacterium]